MQTLIKTVNPNLVTNESVILKKMRILKGLSRKQAGVILGLSYKSIEKLENGRGSITQQRLQAFGRAYGFKQEVLESVCAGKFEKQNLAIYPLLAKKEKDPLRKDRRFCVPQITKECKVLRQLREQKSISQYELSRSCNFGKNVIGFYECGRKNLNVELITFIISKMGYSMADFQEQMNCDELPCDVIAECGELMKVLKLKHLKATRAFLQTFTE